jgi:hypothetical protein
MTINNKLIHLIFPLILIIFRYDNSYSQIKDLADITDYYEKVTFYDYDSGYITDIINYGKTGLKNIYLPLFYDERLELISDISLFYKSGRHYKEYKNPVIKDKPVDVFFHSSKRIKLIELTPNTEFKIKYKKFCKEILFFSGLNGMLCPNE